MNLLMQHLQLYLKDNWDFTKLEAWILLHLYAILLAKLFMLELIKMASRVTLHRATTVAGVALAHSSMISARFCSSVKLVSVKTKKRLNGVDNK